MLFAQREIFNYADRDCTEFGIINCSIANSGLNNELFAGNRTIKETKIRGRSVPYFSEIEADPYEFQLKLFFENGFTEEQLNKAKEWLLTDFYHPFYFKNYPQMIYYCTPVNTSDLSHNSLNQGYVIITMRCNSSFAYSPVTLSPTYTVTTSKIIEIDNLGTENLKPEVWIKRIGAGSVQIVNYSMSQGTFELVNIADTETVYIDNENQDIISDIEFTEHYDDFNDNFLTLTTGRNRLEVFGECEIVFRYQYKYKLG